MLYTEDGKFHISALESDYVQELRKLRNLPEVWNYLANPLLINEVIQENWFRSMSLDPTKQYFTITRDGELVGCIWYDEWDQTNASCRVGIFIHPKYQRKGIAKRVMKVFMDFLLNDMNMNRVWLLVRTDNMPAFNLYIHLGFKVEGTQKNAIYRNNKWHDYIMMAVTK